MANWKSGQTRATWRLLSTEKIRLASCQSLDKLHWTVFSIFRKWLMLSKRTDCGRFTPQWFGTSWFGTRFEQIWYGKVRSVSELIRVSGSVYKRQWRIKLMAVGGDQVTTRSSAVRFQNLDKIRKSFWHWFSSTDIGTPRFQYFTLSPFSLSRLG